MAKRIDWWAGARLCLHGDTADGEPQQLGLGTLVEMVEAAMSRPRSERPRLFVRMELTATEFSWPEILLLAERPDRPMLI